MGRGEDARQVGCGIPTPVDGRDATSSARATVSGARRRSVGGSSHGAGLLAGGSTATSSPRKAAWAWGQLGQRRRPHCQAFDVYRRRSGDRSGWSTAFMTPPFPAKNQDTVVASEAEGVADRTAHLRLCICLADLRTTKGSSSSVLSVPGIQPLLNRQQADHRFEDARSTQRVAGPALGRTGVGVAGCICAPPRRLPLRRSSGWRCRAG